MKGAAGDGRRSVSQEHVRARLLIFAKGGRRIYQTAAIAAVRGSRGRCEAAAAARPTATVGKREDASCIPTAEGFAHRPGARGQQGREGRQARPRPVRSCQPLRPGCAPLAPLAARWWRRCPRCRGRRGWGSESFARPDGEEAGATGWPQTAPPLPAPYPRRLHSVRGTVGARRTGPHRWRRALGRLPLAALWCRCGAPWRSRARATEAGGKSDGEAGGSGATWPSRPPPCRAPPPLPLVVAPPRRRTAPSSTGAMPPSAAPHLMPEPRRSIKNTQTMSDSQTTRDAMWQDARCQPARRAHGMPNDAAGG